jgi:hypothetical protein
MDHSGMDMSSMDHGGMGHGGMDMPSDRCNMNVSDTEILYLLPRLRANNNLADALHMGHQQPLHHLPLLARPRHTLPHHLPSRHCRPGGRLRSHPLRRPTLRGRNHKAHRRRAE